MKPIAIRLAKILAGLVVAALLIHTVLLLGSGLWLRNAYQQLRKDGRPMSAQDIIPRPVPPDENAAPLYQSAFALLDSASAGNESLANALSQAVAACESDPDSEEKLAALERLLATPSVVRALELIDKAAARPRCNFDLPYEQGAMMLFPHANGLLKVSRFQAAQALLDARRGNAAAVWRGIETSFRMADSLREEPVLISALVRLAMLNATASRIAAHVDLEHRHPDTEHPAEPHQVVTMLFDAVLLIEPLNLFQLLGVQLLAVGAGDLQPIAHRVTSRHGTGLVN